MENKVCDGGLKKFVIEMDFCNPNLAGVQPQAYMKLINNKYGIEMSQVVTLDHLSTIQPPVEFIAQLRVQNIWFSLVIPSHAGGF